jgi:monoamine oxidase
MGGMWVGPGQERLYHLAKELGVRTTPQVMVGQNVVVMDGEAFRGGMPGALDMEALGAFATATAEIEDLARKVVPDAPWQTPGADRLDTMTLATWIEERIPQAGARALMATVVNSVFATDPGNLSVLGVARYAALGGGWGRLTGTQGGAQQDRFIGGVEPLARKLADLLGDSLRLEFPVRVVRTGRNVLVEGDRGAVTARRAVIAIPPTLAGRITYDPPLPGRRDQLTQRLPAGSVIKFHAIFAHPWWRSEGLSGQILGPGTPIGVTFDTSPPNAGVITGFFEGRHAVEMGLKSQEERRKTVVEFLALAMGDRARELVAYADLDWSQEPWTRGCYGAHFPPGAWTTYGQALREPVGLIHWAGTETARLWTGYIDGAIESGERVAAEVAKALTK